MKPFLPVVLAFVLMGQAGPTELDPDRIAQDIDAHGAREVVDRLWASDSYEEMLRRIAAGDGAWIALTPRLAPGTDAGAAEGLTIALAEALPHNPQAILSVLDPGRNALSPSRVCGVPFLEGTAIDIPDYIRSAESAVSSVREARLKSERTACLAALRKG